MGNAIMILKTCTDLVGTIDNISKDSVVNKSEAPRGYRLAGLNQLHPHREDRCRDNLVRLLPVIIVQGHPEKVMRRQMKWTHDIWLIYVLWKSGIVVCEKRRNFPRKRRSKSEEKR